MLEKILIALLFICIGLFIVFIIARIRHYLNCENIEPTEELLEERTNYRNTFINDLLRYLQYHFGTNPAPTVQTLQDVYDETIITMSYPDDTFCDIRVDWNAYSFTLNIKAIENANPFQLREKFAFTPEKLVNYSTLQAFLEKFEIQSEVYFGHQLEEIVRYGAENKATLTKLDDKVKCALLFKASDDLYDWLHAYEQGKKFTTPEIKHRLYTLYAQLLGYTLAGHQEDYIEWLKGEYNKPESEGVGPEAEAEAAVEDLDADENYVNQDKEAN